MSKLEIKKIPINKIKFDNQNPRIKYVNPFKNATTEEEQNEAIPSLLKDPSEKSAGTYSYNTLKASIVAAGSIVNPIWVKQAEEDYICIEGNTRLSVYRDLFNDEEDKGNWEEIPAIVYTNLSEQEEHKLKLTAHVVGTRTWTPYSRAKYVNELLEGTFSWEQITDIVGGRRNELANAAQAQKDFDEFFVNEYTDTSERAFSYFVEATSKNIFEKLEEHNVTKKDFASWLYHDKFRRAGNVQHLPAIFNMPEAKSVFLAEGGKFDDAWPIVIGDPEVNLASVTTNSLVAELITRLDKLAEEDEEFFKDKVGQELLHKLVILASSLQETLTSLPEAELDKYFGNKS
tara:strand:+ start:949 stop:1983 length:1035 start_codon:yes stop_codon:yes gene_type:complete